VAATASSGRPHVQRCSVAASDDTWRIEMFMFSFLNVEVSVFEACNVVIIDVS